MSSKLRRQKSGRYLTFKLKRRETGRSSKGTKRKLMPRLLAWMLNSIKRFRKRKKTMLRDFERCTKKVCKGRSRRSEARQLLRWLKRR